RVELCRPAGAGPGPTGPPLVRHEQEAGLAQPLETRARDVSMDPEARRKLIRGQGLLPRSHEEKCLPKLRVADCLEPVHDSRTLTRIENGSVDVPDEGTSGFLPRCLDCGGEVVAGRLAGDVAL